MLDLNLKRAMQGYVNGGEASKNNVGTPIKLRDKSYLAISGVMEKFLESNISAFEKAEARSQEELISALNDMERARIQNKLEHLSRIVGFVTKNYTQIKERAEAIKSRALSLGDEFQEIYNNGRVSQEMDIEKIKTAFDAAQRRVNAYGELDSTIVEEDKEYVFDEINSEDIENQVNETLSQNEELDIDEVSKRVLASYKNPNYTEEANEIPAADLNALLEPTFADIEGIDRNPNGMSQEEIDTLHKEIGESQEEETDILDDPVVQKTLAEARLSLEKKSSYDKDVPESLEENNDVEITAEPTGDLADLGEDFNIERFTGGTIADLREKLAEMRSKQEQSAKEKEDRQKELEDIKAKNQAAKDQRDKLSKRRDEAKEKAETAGQKAKNWKKQLEEAEEIRNLCEQIALVQEATMSENDETSKLVSQIEQVTGNLNQTKDSSREITLETKKYESQFESSMGYIKEQKANLWKVREEIMAYQGIITPSVSEKEAAPSGARHR